MTISIRNISTKEATTRLQLTRGDQIVRTTTTTSQCIQMFFNIVSGEVTVAALFLASQLDTLVT